MAIEADRLPGGNALPAGLLTPDGHPVIRETVLGEARQEWREFAARRREPPFQDAAAGGMVAHRTAHDKLRRPEGLHLHRHAALYVGR